jgi:hypothetical protein
VAGESRLKMDAKASSKFESDCRVQNGDSAVGFFYPLNREIRTADLVEFFGGKTPSAL